MMKHFLVAVIVTISSVIAPISAAQENISVTDGHIRALIPGTSVTSAYMTISNASDKAAVLVGAQGDFSQRIEIHEHVMNDGMMSMRQRDSLTIESKSDVTLQPRGYHLMIFDIVKPLNDGDEATLTLLFEGNEKKTITIPVQSIKRQSTSHQHHHEE